MDFITTARALMDLQKTFPDMRWDLSIHDGLGESQVSVHFFVPAETANLLEDGMKMFEPV